MCEMHTRDRMAWDKRELTDWEIMMHWLAVHLRSM